jgi:hypothetical protein
MLLSEGQMSDHKGARFMLDALPPASALIADRGYDSNWVLAGADGQRRRTLHPAHPEPETASRLRQGALSKGMSRGAVQFSC